MSLPALLVLEDSLTQNWSNEEWQGFTVYSGENPNPNPNINFLVKKAILANQMTISRTSVNEESFRIILPLEMSPPRDKAVPLPVLPQPMMQPRKKLRHQETMPSLRKSKKVSHQESMTRFPEKSFYKVEEEDFRCNAFCLSFPKLLRSLKREDSMKKKMIKESSFSTTTTTDSSSCGSVASTTSLATARSFFDLPMEMIKSEGGDVQEPVSLGFFFDKETRSKGSRSVLKTSNSMAEKSPQRRVRFSNKTSVSCPSSPRSFTTPRMTPRLSPRMSPQMSPRMSPRLLKARDEFKMFLASEKS